jgi:hypothetical protein
MTRRTLLADLLVVGLLLGVTHCRAGPEKSTDITPSPQDISRHAPAGLGGTSWQLVKFQGGDGLTLTPARQTRHRAECYPRRSGWRGSPRPR